jgi:hypothetical protein
MGRNKTLDPFSLMIFGLLYLAGAFVLIGVINGLLPWALWLLPWVLLLGLLWIVVAVVTWISSWFNAPAPSRTVTHSTTWRGDKKKTIKYQDTGKEVQQISSSDLLGRKTKRTYVTKPGEQRQSVRYQTSGLSG